MLDFGDFWVVSGGVFFVLFLGSFIIFWPDGCVCLSCC